MGNYSFGLEDWQVYAIQQVLGLLTDFENGTTTSFTRETVEKRLDKMGRLEFLVGEVDPDDGHGEV